MIGPAESGLIDPRHVDGRLLMARLNHARLVRIVDQPTTLHP
jgi:hypothetical protein